MTIADQMLRVLKIGQEIVEVWRRRISSESLIGVVSDFSDEFLYLSLFSEAGAANGIAILFRRDITRIRWSGNERRSITELVAASGAKPTRPPMILDSMQTVLRSVSDAFGYVNVLTEHLDDSITFIGEIVELDEDSLLLETYGTFSTRDRSKLLLCCDDITRVDADAAYERSVSYLARMSG